MPTLPRPILILCALGFAACVLVGKAAERPDEPDPLTLDRAEPMPESMTARYHARCVLMARGDGRPSPAGLDRLERLAWQCGEPEQITPSELLRALAIDPLPWLPLDEAVRQTGARIAAERAAWFVSDEPLAE